ncbi:uncharacterized protein LOC144101458 isoform X2 [Amblyomma americanum]
MVFEYRMRSTTVDLDREMERCEAAKEIIEAAMTNTQCATAQEEARRAYDEVFRRPMPPEPEVCTNRRKDSH